MPRDNTGSPSALKGPSLKGALIVDTVNGNLRVRRWPPKRPTRSDAQKARENRFTQANRLWRYIDDRYQSTLQEATKGSPFYPRDLFVSAVYGRLFLLIDQATGNKVYPVAARDDVSDSLDALGQTIGAIAIRFPEGWRIIPPGDLGEVLTSQGAGNLPEWRPGGGGGGLPSAWWGNGFNGGAAGDAGATKGMYTESTRDVEIYAVGAAMQPVLNGTYRGGVIISDVLDAITEITWSANWVAPDTFIRTQIFEMPTPVQVPAGSRVSVVINRTDGGDNYVLRPRYDNVNQYVAFPGTEPVLSRIAKADPQIGETLEVGFASGSYSVGCFFGLA